MATARSIQGGVRFAPSPTGNFHVGNFRTAWISREAAKALGLPWVVRFEDIDGPRVVAGARERQLEELVALGLVPARVELQSERLDRHRSLFEAASADGAVYPCACSRREAQEALAAAASAPHGAEAVYSGRCRYRAPSLEERRRLPGIAWRFRSGDPSGSGDFIVARTEPDGGAFAPAYHWACAIDDWDGGYDLLVRAWDLESATGAQRQVMAWLRRREASGREYPAVFHTALVTDDSGHRLEKRTRGVTLPELLAGGGTPETFQARFAATFTFCWSKLAPGAVFGEERRRMSLTDLGLSPTPQN